ncbi:hypothetical protein JYB64_15165 [Algoriphagus aestuarii]|nr:hypothetical protein [Algoriphagus aestuarii]
MIKFFRKIRQKLIKEKRVKNYLIYALGEIVLVVIGILIALAINNANLRRIDSNNEQNYLEGLRFEFQVSQMKLAELLTVNQKNLDGSREILNYIHSEEPNVTEERLSELLFETLSDDISFNPNNSFLNELINSGNLKNISSIDLRNKLTSWIATMDDIKRQEAELSSQREDVLDLFRSENFSILTILDRTGVREALDITASPEAHSNLGILDSREFENDLLIFMLTSEATKTNHYEPLMQGINAILEEIEKELKE